MPCSSQMQVEEPSTCRREHSAIASLLRIGNGELNPSNNKPGGTGQLAFFDFFGVKWDSLRIFDQSNPVVTLLRSLDFTMSALPCALKKSETKSKLLKHLHMSEEVYTTMAVSAFLFQSPHSCASDRSWSRLRLLSSALLMYGRKRRMRFIGSWWMI